MYIHMAQFSLTDVHNTCSVIIEIFKIYFYFYPHNICPFILLNIHEKYFLWWYVPKRSFGSFHSFEKRNGFSPVSGFLSAMAMEVMKGDIKIKEILKFKQPPTMRG